MSDVDILLSRYRECVRHIWNTVVYGEAIASDWEVVLQYRDVATLLFDLCVQRAIGHEICRDETQSLERPYIRIVPRRGDDMPVHINRKAAQESGQWDHPIHRVARNGTELQFIEFFDFDELAARDMQYFVAAIRRCEEYPQVIGHRALVEVQYAMAELVTGITAP